MRKLLTAAAILATLTTGLAHADTFDFSYAFTTPNSLTSSYPGGDILTGSFMGTLNTSTDLISNISNINLILDGVAFSGPLIAFGWNTATSSFSNTIAPLVSPIASLNNFAFGDAGVAIGNPNQYLAFINDPNPDGPGIVAFNGNIVDGSGNQLSVSDNPANASWKVVDVSPVPVPLPTGAQIILAAGLALLSTAARRRLDA